ncbi:MAG: SRPBCC domain-containing protein [Alcanivoracaceae bacterium]|nr:SRPBCC domain-containing protein [Alcanivoracaceae bacterium]
MLNQSNNTHKLEINRLFNCDSETLFKAIAEGGLFKSCGANEDKMSIDFKVGGKYVLEWDKSDPTKGEFTEILPFEKIGFTWEFYSELTETKMTTIVSINIQKVGNKSRLILIHSGFSNISQVDRHTHGWTAGLDNFGL